MTQASAAARMMTAALAAVVACGPRADHERIGDRRYAEGAYTDAMAEYRLASRQRRPSAELWAKLGSAALRAGALEEAARAWRDLAAADATARLEATEGLMRTAQGAAAANDVRALRLAVQGLRDLAPSRLGELGPALVGGLDPERRADDDADFLLAAASHAARPAADSLLVTWADLTLRAGRCAAASQAYEGVLRRSVPAIQRLARGGLAHCRVEAARALLAAGQLIEAEVQLRDAIALGTPDSTVRLAWLLVGDVRWAGGDTTGAITAYGRVVQGGEADSDVVRRAEEQLQRLLGGNQTDL